VFKFSPTAAACLLGLVSVTVVTPLRRACQSQSITVLSESRQCHQCHGARLVTWHVPAAYAPGLCRPAL
jgi:hypothetical protein